MADEISLSEYIDPFTSEKVNNNSRQGRQLRKQSPWRTFNGLASAAGNSPFQGQSKPPAKPVVLISNHERNNIFLMLVSGSDIDLFVFSDNVCLCGKKQVQHQKRSKWNHNKTRAGYRLHLPMRVMQQWQQKHDTKENSFSSAGYFFAKFMVKFFQYGNCGRLYPVERYFVICIFPKIDTFSSVGLNTATMKKHIIKQKKQYQINKFTTKNIERQQIIGQDQIKTTPKRRGLHQPYKGLLIASA